MLCKYGILCITVEQICVQFTNFVTHLTIEGIQISAAKVVLFAWTSWKISGVRHWLWRLHYFPCKHFCLPLSLMILKMLWWHSRLGSFSLLLWNVSSRMLCVFDWRSTFDWYCLFFLSPSVILSKLVFIYGWCSIWKTIRHLSILLATGQKVLPRHHLVGLKLR